MSVSSVRGWARSVRSFAGLVTLLVLSPRLTRPWLPLTASLPGQWSGVLGVETPTRGWRKMKVTASRALGAQEKIPDSRSVGGRIPQQPRYLQTHLHSSGPQRG